MVDDNKKNGTDLFWGIYCRLPLFFLKARFFSPAVNHMADGQYWMTPGHARTCIAHDHTDLFTQLRLIAMDRTVAAGGLIFPERTVLEPEPGVLLQFAALIAEFTPGMMMVLTVKSDHQLNGLPLSFHAGMHLGHGFLHDGLGGLLISLSV